MGYLIETVYFLTAALFILGLKRMSHPTTARSGIIWAGYGMVLATVVSFVHPQITAHVSVTNYALMLIAIAIGGAIAWYGAKKVAMTAMPQMIAIYNGMGGGAAAAIAAVELLKDHGDKATAPGTSVLIMAVAGALIGAVSFSGSVVAFGKLQELKFFKDDAKFRFTGQQKVNLAIFASAVLLGLIVAVSHSTSGPLITLFFLLALAFGAMMALPIGGADMPVVISLFNAFTGLAVALEGFVLGNSAMIIAGIIVGSSGTLLTLMMAKAMNRSVSNVLFSNWAALGTGEAQEVTGSLKPMEPQDAAIQMAYASKVIIVPGYGMAVAQAQHKIWEMCKLLIERGATVKFAIHPVAGRMPGHMNVLLAEAGVPYDYITDIDEINEEFATADVALVIGANDVVNPAARNDKSSPIYGMPILNVDYAKNVQVIKRGKGVGFAGIENALFFADNTRMVYGDAQKVVAALIQGIKELG
ncbi:MAG: NAD(P)(+) transhydrogenase (Re/Si-specific) subunit beta [Candidatus Competibacteraceae bacterium]|uniref:NAD(P) transhydrogenase subunit beta n=1 Tax=Candidatus Contendobacter odensis Run_B_J11 TaxID=1400861 RepID=A0A7U7GBQ2_9GAMM|nr:NAD(P)(+) transhydrogenase (Re/Si-specific) subunit beta [Candidatus Contendobacter odensis]MBK8534791.1 NAD(P)(+) transhydrogenase (Re/Si-specific) subunit beta [Candidatus Competibacteraceae bacterium]MBK8753559.1 NAD(P)(+) transhydrogenase (Re/Si-specific) subunit beta [Candidatus Competibacteraceae bacterium]CDH45234.1 pyridine nucleotide transhydrogenase (proton pump), beta subunit [Candidatus Contendobacter odensis Run_B_J11]